MKYIRIYILFVKTSIMMLMAHRFNLFMSAVANVVWTMTQIIGLKYMFEKIPQFEGWTFPEMVLLLGMGQLFVYVFYVIYENNFRKFPDKVIKGELDRILTKPINLKFVISFEYFSVAQVMPMITTVAPLIIYGFINLENISPERILLSFFIQLIGMIIFFFTMLSIAGLAFFIDDARSLYDTYISAVDINRVPLDILPKVLKHAMTFVVPVAFVTFYPTQILKNDYDLKYIFASEFLLLIAVTLISKIIWSEGLKRYSGAN